MTVRVIIFDLAATGVSGDTKPTFVDGGLFFEEDTGKVFVTQGGAWVENLNPSYGRTGSIGSGWVAEDGVDGERGPPGPTGPAGAAGGGGSATQVTITLPTPASKRCAVVVTDATVTGSSKITLALAGTPPTAQNEIEDIEMLSMGALPAAGSFTFQAGFANPISGPILVNYTVG